MSGATRNSRRVRSAGRALFGARSRVSASLARAADVRVSADWRGLRWLSVAAIVLLAMQVGTGILLSLYYYPEPGAAWSSTRFVTGEAPVGWLVRGAHRWAADLLLLTVLAHLAVAYARRAYAKPREGVWLVGVLLLAAVHALRFTGSLLPYDAEAVASARRGLELLAEIPVFGSVPAAWLRGGEQVGGNTLSRFFTTHALILPWVAVGLMALHLRLVRGAGLKAGAR